MLAVPYVAAAQAAAPVPAYVLRLAAENGRPCTPPQERDVVAVGALVADNVPGAEVAPSDSPDPLGDAVAALRASPAAARRIVVATLCKNGETDAASIRGYVLRRHETGRVSVSTGTPVAGTLDVLRTATWKTLFTNPATPAPQNVPYEPVVGGVADTVNARLERTLPLAEVDTPSPPLALCRGSAYNLLVMGLGSAATANQDPLRAALGALAASSFSQPGRWGSVYKITGAIVPILGVPTTAEAAVEMFYCDDTGLYQFGGRNHHIVGHAETLSIGAGSAVRRRILTRAVDDLRNQVGCVMMRYLRAESAVTDATVAADPIAAPRWCEDYYAELRTHAELVMSAKDLLLSP